MDVKPRSAANEEVHSMNTQDSLLISQQQNQSASSNHLQFDFFYARKKEEFSLVEFADWCLKLTIILNFFKWVTHVTSFTFSKLLSMIEYFANNLGQVRVFSVDFCCCFCINMINAACVFLCILFISVVFVFFNFWLTFFTFSENRSARSVEQMNKTKAHS